MIPKSLKKFAEVIIHICDRFE